MEWTREKKLVGQLGSIVWTLVGKRRALRTPVWIKVFFFSLGRCSLLSLIHLVVAVEDFSLWNSKEDRGSKAAIINSFTKDKVRVNGVQLFVEKAR